MYLLWPKYIPNSPFTVNVGLEGFAMPEEGRRQDSRGLHDGQQTDTTVRRTRRDGTALSRLPTWPSCSNASGLNEAPAPAPAPSDIESNEARKASRLFPMGFSAISHYSWSVIANGVLSMRSEKEEARPVACLRQPLLCQACGNPTFASACRRAANDGTLAYVATSQAA